jgi:hypothetical protein
MQPSRLDSSGPGRGGYSSSYVEYRSWISHGLIVVEYLLNIAKGLSLSWIFSQAVIILIITFTAFVVAVRTQQSVVLLL